MHRLHKWLRRRRDGGPASSGPVATATAAGNLKQIETKSGGSLASGQGPTAVAPSPASQTAAPPAAATAGRCNLASLPLSSSYSVAAGAGVLPGHDDAECTDPSAAPLPPPPAPAPASSPPESRPSPRRADRGRGNPPTPTATPTATPPDGSKVSPRQLPTWEPTLERESARSSRHDSSRSFSAGGLGPGGLEGRCKGGAKVEDLPLVCARGDGGDGSCRGPPETPRASSEGGASSGTGTGTDSASTAGGNCLSQSLRSQPVGATAATPTAAAAAPLATEPAKLTAVAAACSSSGALGTGEARSESGGGSSSAVPSALGTPRVSSVLAVAVEDGAVEAPPTPHVAAGPPAAALPSPHGALLPAAAPPPPRRRQPPLHGGARPLFEASYQERQVEMRLRQVVFGSFNQRGATPTPAAAAVPAATAQPLWSCSSCGGLDAAGGGAGGGSATSPGPAGSSGGAAAPLPGAARGAAAAAAVAAGPAAPPALPNGHHCGQLHARPAASGCLPYTGLPGAAPLRGSSPAVQPPRIPQAGHPFGSGGGGGMGDLTGGGAGPGAFSGGGGGGGGASAISARDLLVGRAGNPGRSNPHVAGAGGYLRDPRQRPSWPDMAASTSQGNTPTPPLTSTMLTPPPPPSTTAVVLSMMSSAPLPAAPPFLLVGAAAVPSAEGASRVRPELSAVPATPPPVLQPPPNSPHSAAATLLQPLKTSGASPTCPPAPPPPPPPAETPLQTQAGGCPSFGPRTDVSAEIGGVCTAAAGADIAAVVATWAKVGWEIEAQAAGTESGTGTGLGGVPCGGADGQAPGPAGEVAEATSAVAAWLEVAAAAPPVPAAAEFSSEPSFRLQLRRSGSSAAAAAGQASFGPSHPSAAALSDGALAPEAAVDVDVAATQGPGAKCDASATGGGGTAAAAAAVTTAARPASDALNAQAGGVSAAVGGAAASSTTCRGELSPASAALLVAHVRARGGSSGGGGGSSSGGGSAAAAPPQPRAVAAVLACLGGDSDPAEGPTSENQSPRAQDPVSRYGSSGGGSSGGTCFSSSSPLGPCARGGAVLDRRRRWASLATAAEFHMRVGGSSGGGGRNGSSEGSSRCSSRCSSRLSLRCNDDDAARSGGGSTTAGVAAALGVGLSGVAGTGSGAAGAAWRHELHSRGAGRLRSRSQRPSLAQSLAWVGAEEEAGGDAAAAAAAAPPQGGGEAGLAGCGALQGGGPIIQLPAWTASGAARPEGPLARCVAECLMTMNPLFRSGAGDESSTPEGLDSGAECEEA